MKKVLAKYEHLNPNVVELLALSDEERIARVRNQRWIGYTTANQIIKRMEELLVYPKTHRMPNMLIVGRTNNGKSMLANKFIERHPAYDNPTGDGIIVPVLYISAPPKPDENLFFNSILSKIFAPYKPHDHPSKKLIQIIEQFKQIDLRMLLIDEIHDILAGHLEKQRQFLNTLKFIGNELQIPIVGLGTKDAIRALKSDSQLENRFEPVPLPRWKLDKEFLRLLMSFERMLPLKNPSNLVETKLATKLISLSEGTIGELADLLRRAAVLAIETKKEKIDTNLLNDVQWNVPSDRRRAIEKLI